MTSPDFETFCELAEQGKTVPVYRTLLADTLTPVSAYMRLPKQGLAYPLKVFDIQDGSITIKNADGTCESHKSEDPHSELEAMVHDYDAVSMPGLPRFSGGAVGYVSYDAVRLVEKLGTPPHDDLQRPDFYFMFFTTMIAFDHVNKTLKVINHALPSGGDLREVYDEACAKIDAVVDALRQPIECPVADDIDLGKELTRPFQSNVTRDEFEASVLKCKEYIKAGDVFQVVLSQRLEVETKVSPLELYRVLRFVNPSPYLFLLRMDEASMVGSSPEVMVRVEDGEITLRPLAGTRRRGNTDEEDKALAEDLLSDPKEIAEHTMLVDLGRNDVGRVSEYNSVEITECMAVEQYSHVMHIVSNVKGRLKKGCTPIEALKSSSPAGTLSGAPKIRAMQIIDECETTKRGPYGGSVGCFDFHGNLETCIAIRTVLLQDGKAYVQSGAGIVADSVPATEYEETLSKAKAVLRAIELADERC